MKTVTLEAFEYSELSDNAKMKASENYEPICNYDFSDTIQAIQKIFPISNIEIDHYWRVSANIDDQDEEDQKTFEQYQKDFKYPNDSEYGLTGTYSDCSFLNSLPKNNKLTREDFEYALKKLAKAYEEELNYELSGDVLTEYYNSNNIFFLKDGTMI